MENNSMKDPKALAIREEAARIREQAQALLEIYQSLIGDAIAPIQVKVWLLEYDAEVIKQAFVELAKWRMKATGEMAAGRLDKVCGGILRNSKAKGMTPEERAAELSRLNALKGTIGAAKRWQKERAEALQSLAEVCHEQPSAAINGHDAAIGGHESASLRCKVLGVRGKDVKSKKSDVGSSVPNDSLKSLKPSNRKTRKPKTCRHCGGPLSRDKNHTCENTGGTSRPPSPAASPSSADNIPAAPEAPESAAPPSDYYTRYQTCPFCWEAKIPYDLYQKHLAECKAKHEQAAQAAAQGASIQ